MDSLFQSPPIIENIFKHLGARDLSNCARVCKLWKSMSVVELKKRPKIDYFFQTTERDHIRDLEHDGIECAFEEELRKQLKNCLRIKPSFCIALASEALLENCHYLFPRLISTEPFKKRQKTKFFSDDFWNSLIKRDAQSVIEHVLKAHLPARSKYVFAVAPGIIGCCSGNTSVEVEDGCTITGFCLPKIPGVEVHFYDYLKCNLQDIVSEERKGKCMLVFDSFSNSADFSGSPLNTILNKCVKNNPNLAIGGAIVRHSVGNESKTGKVLVFSGEKVEAASVIIKKQDDKKELKNKLKLFEETGLLQNQCFAFMFACVARGYYFYKEQNLESSTFHSLYPNVPLIGVFGNGEIGVNYLPNQKYPAQKQYFFQYTTVFVLVSVKK